MWGSGLCHQDVLTYVCLWSSCLGWVGHKKATNASPGGLGLHPLPTKQPEVTPGFVPEAQTSVLPHGEGKLSCNSCSMPYSSLRPPEEEPSSRCADTAPRASAFVISACIRKTGLLPAWEWGLSHMQPRQICLCLGSLDDFGISSLCHRAPLMLRCHSRARRQHRLPGPTLLSKQALGPGLPQACPL